MFTGYYKITANLAMIAYINKLKDWQYWSPWFCPFWAMSLNQILLKFSSRRVVAMLTHTEIHLLWVLQIWLMCSLTAWALWMKWLLSWLEAERLCNNILSLMEVVSAMESEPVSLVSSHNTIWCTWINGRNYVTVYLFILFTYIYFCILT